MIRMKMLYLLSAGLLALPASQALAQMPGDFEDSVIETVMQQDEPAGQVDYTAQVLSTTGTGVPVPGQPPAQAAQGAIRAALVDARRNLIALVEGVRIDAETTVRDHMLASDIIRERVSGVVRGAVEIPELRQHKPDGTVTVTVALGIRNQLAGVVLPTDGFEPVSAALPPIAPPVERSRSALLRAPIVAPPALPPGPASASKTTPAATGAPTGLIIDARGLNVRPAMAPKVLDESGNEIYGTREVSRTWAIQMGVVTYGKSADSDGAMDRVGDNPLVIKAQQTSGKNNVDVTVSQADAQRIQETNAGGDYLAKCRVMFLVD
jgi:hypothetical protein